MIVCIETFDLVFSTRTVENAISSLGNFPTQFSGNLATLGVEPLVEKQPLFSQMIQTYKWSNKVKSQIHILIKCMCLFFYIFVMYNRHKSLLLPPIHIFKAVIHDDHHQPNVEGFKMSSLFNHHCTRTLNALSNCPL